MIDPPESLFDDPAPGENMKAWGGNMASQLTSTSSETRTRRRLGGWETISAVHPSVVSTQCFPFPWPLKVAQKALADAASLSTTTSKAPMPPLQSALLVDKDRSDSERQSPEAQPTAIDRRSETENILQMAESALSVESREARESYTIQVHSFKTRTKAEQVVAHY
jgi:hypothetical protein